MYDRNRGCHQQWTVRVYWGQTVIGPEIFPTILKKYKTDGVEHNMYGGNRLPNKKLTTLPTCIIPSPLATAGDVWNGNPILPKPGTISHTVAGSLDDLCVRRAHHHPLSYRWKQFDVDGAYNVRYEMIKKRIDKARIKTVKYDWLNRRNCIVFPTADRTRIPKSIWSFTIQKVHRFQYRSGRCGKNCKSQAWKPF